MPPNLLVDDDAGDLADAVVEALLDEQWRREVGTSNRQHVAQHHEIGRQCAAMGAALTSVER